MLIIFYILFFFFTIRLLVLWIKRLRENTRDRIIEKQKIRTKMDVDAFWKIIESSRTKVGNQSAHLSKLKKTLRKLDDTEIVHFANRFDSFKNKAYRWDLWGAIYLLAGGCGDDSFEYFREWLICQGKEKFERAIKDPETIKDFVDPNGDWEGFGYCAFEVYKEKTKRNYLPTDGKAKEEPTGQEWDEEKLTEMFPGIAAAIKLN